MGKRKPLHRHPIIRRQEYEARAIMLDGEYIPGANLIQVTKAAVPTVWYCANQLIELPEKAARQRLMASGFFNRDKYLRSRKKWGPWIDDSP